MLLMRDSCECGSKLLISCQNFLGLILIVVTRIEKKGIHTFCVIIIWNKLEVNVQKAENVNMCKKYITKLDMAKIEMYD